MATVVFFLAGHLCAVNDLFDFAGDKRNLRRQDRPLVSGQVSAKEQKILSFVLGILGFLLCLLLPLRSLLIAILSVANLWCYQHPRISLKTIPILSSLNQLTAGTLQFLFGYSLFKSIDISGVLIGLYFGIIFMAGHLNQEIGDYDADLKTGILTNSVKFGKKKMYFLSFSFFSLSSIYFYLLSLHNIVPREWGVLVLIIYPFYLFFFYSTLRKGISFENISKFRKDYRLLYAIMGCFMGFYLLRSSF